MSWKWPGVLVVGTHDRKVACWLTSGARGGEGRLPGKCDSREGRKGRRASTARRRGSQRAKGARRDVGGHSTATVRPIEQSVSSAPNWSVLPWISLTSPM